MAITPTHRPSTTLLLVLTLTLGLSVRPPAHAQDAQPTFDVWPGKVPGETGNIGPETVSPKEHGDKPIHLVTNVTKPTLTLFRAPKDKDTGAAVVICPGGGYSVLAWDLEGTEVAEWLNSIGVTGIVLKYRVPKRPDQTASAPPLQDAQRAMSLVRSRSGEWGIDPGRIGMLGFSAGGNLTALACTHYDHRTYEPADDADKVSCRPDFGVLVYPAWLVEEDKEKPVQLKPEFPVNNRTPQMFLAHASDDGISAASSAGMYLALKKAGVPAELHVYATGGHGFGLRPTNKPCSTWPQRCEIWMRSQGLLTRDKAAPPAPPAKPAADAGEGQWTPVFADAEWYRGQKGEEKAFEGTLEAVAPPQASTLQRASFYKLGDRTVYTGAKKVPALDALVGKKVQMKGRAVDMELEGTSVREIWPAAVRAAG